MKIRKSGFTLVELLIVIALIAILSVAVLATINPIEQSNKARDAAMKNDAAELLSAYERYYASQSGYPWNIGLGVTVSVGTPISIGGSNPLSGVVGTGTSEGVLISTSELKDSFASKKPFITSAKDEDKIYTYSDGADKNYVCFIPKATANRMTGAGPNPNLKCMTIDPTGSSSKLANIGLTCKIVTSWTGTNLVPGADKANLMCVPEGDIQ